jgi:protein-S-isoprenylcysteine O-methyltransferase Ste14
MYLKRARQGFCSLFGLLSLVVTLYALVKFILFVSSPQQQKHGKPSRELKVAARHLVHNSIWLVVFILQHSLQKHENVKSLFKKFGLSTIERSAYNLLSSLILLVRRFPSSTALPGRCFGAINQIRLNVKISFQQLVQSWTFVDKWTLWNISAPDFSPTWWIFTVTHSILWSVIAFGSLLMDLPEIFGIKQIYYDIQGLNEPFSYKARSLSRLLSSIRHPSYVGFSLIFWITNLMR